MIDRKEKRRLISKWFIFHWLAERNTKRTILAFLLFSAVIHLTAIYLFIFEYPSRASQVRTDKITILDPSQIEVRAYLEKIRDRSFYLDPPSSDSTSQLKLSDYAIRFAPSFAQVKPELKRGLSGENVVQFDVPDFDDNIVGRAQVNPINFSPNLARRGVAPYSIFDDYLSLLSEIPTSRIPLEINPAGIPIRVDVIEGSLQDRQLLEKAIKSSLRFNPTTTETGNAPGWMELTEPQE